MSSYLITGASRGLGLGLVTQLSELPASQVPTIFAVARQASPELQDLVKSSPGRIHYIQAEVTREDSIKKAVVAVEDRLAGKGLDVLVNNVGIMTWTPGGIAKMDDLTECVDVNVLTAHYMIRNFLPLIEKSTARKIANITSKAGSLTLAPTFMMTSVSPAYKISKAALNMLTVQYALEYGSKGLVVFGLSPGWVRTDMGSERADLSLADGSAAALEKIMNATKEDNGQFLTVRVRGWDTAGAPNIYDGKNAPW